MASGNNPTFSATFIDIPHGRVEYLLLASKQSEQDTIRGVQIRAGAVYVHIYIYTTLHHF